MKIQQSIAAPIRQHGTWEERWEGPDSGLIACWERGREKSSEDKQLAEAARSGQLVVLPWKGGVEKSTKLKKKFGTHFYLAMWQGLRGDDLNITSEEEVSITCSATGTTVIFTSEATKFSESQ